MIPLYIIGFLMLGSLPLGPDQNKQVRAVIRAERAFAEASRTSGMRAAFLAFLADDGILFRPGPVPGRQWTQDRPEPKASLLWRPVYADVAISGELGYTTGPWEYRSNADPQRVGHGHYVTLWRKAKGGGWKVVLDAGVTTPEYRLRDTAVAHPTYGARTRYTPLKGSEPAQELMALDATLRYSPDGSHAKTWSGLIAEDVRVYRDGMAPALGRAAALALPDSVTIPGSSAHTVTAAHIAESGDLAYTYGVLTRPGEGGKTETSGYLRIWKRDAARAWRLVLDLL